MFTMSLSVEELKAYVAKQILHFFPDGKFKQDDYLFAQSLQDALDRTEYCFKHVSLTSYHKERETFFSHLHADQYTVFLWFLSNSIWKRYEDSQLASKVFTLNKMINGLICMYDTRLPDIFLIIHGGGIVLGKASYQDYFVCYQGCTVGAIEGKYPILGKGVAMAPQSSIIGNCSVGDFATIGNQALLRNSNVPSHTVYYKDTNSGAHLAKKSSKSPWSQSFFHINTTQT